MKLSVCCTSHSSLRLACLGGAGLLARLPALFRDRRLAYRRAWVAPDPVNSWATPCCSRSLGLGRLTGTAAPWTTRQQMTMPVVFSIVSADRKVESPTELVSSYASDVAALICGEAFSNEPGSCELRLHQITSRIVHANDCLPPRSWRIEINMRRFSRD